MKVSDQLDIELVTLDLSSDSLLTAQSGSLKSLYKYSYYQQAYIHVAFR